VLESSFSSPVWQEEMEIRRQTPAQSPRRRRVSREDQRRPRPWQSCSPGMSVSAHRTADPVPREPFREAHSADEGVEEVEGGNQAVPSAVAASVVGAGKAFQVGACPDENQDQKAGTGGRVDPYPYPGLEDR
jgi:hypothetical protein